MPYATLADAEIASKTDLAVRIDAAVQQRRAEISQIRDHALDAADTAMMESADQMEKVLDTFIEARLRCQNDAQRVRRR